MQICDPNLVVFVVVEEEQLIQRLGHVIDAARAGWVKDFLFEPAAIRLGYFHLQVTLWNGRPTMGSIAINAHGAEVHHVNIETRLNDGGKQVVGAVDVVINGVALGGAALHRIGRSALFGEVNNGVGFLIPE